MKWSGLLLLASVVSSVPTKDRAFSLFSVVTFSNEECTATSESTGICQTSTECTDNGGTSTGNCASGFGVCCVYTDSTCGTNTEIKNNGTFLQNPGYASTYSETTQTCSFNIIGSADICQIRLDFMDVVLNDPAAASGECAATGDVLTVTSPSGSGGAAQFAYLCGQSLTGSHLYIETAMNSPTAAAVSIVTGSTASASRWSIKVRMIECDNPGKAPTDCLQYYTGASGTVSSFNAMVGQPDNLNYVACIRQEKDMCTIQYSEATATPDSFGIDIATNADAALNLAGGCIAGYVELGNTQHCGAFFSDTDAATTAGTVTSTVFNLGVFAPDGQGGLTEYPGFILKYLQIPC